MNAVLCGTAIAVRGRHRPGARNQPSRTCHEHRGVGRRRRRDTYHQACRGHDAVVGADHRRVKPALASAVTAFAVGSNALRRQRRSMNADVARGEVLM